MADTTPVVETATPGAPSNEVTPVATTPVVNTTDTAEVERLKKDAEQARMRANQVENELKKFKDAQEEDQRKRLEENEEWKSLAEQEKAKREALEQEQEATTKSQELKEATTKLFSKYPAEVVELAEETGLGLSDTTDDAVAALQAKLDKIATKVVSQKPVTPNNPGSPTTATDAELMQRMRAGDRDARAQIIGNLPGVQEMRKMAGLSEE